MPTFKVSSTAWKVITGAVVILSLLAGFWQFEDRYAKAEDVIQAFDTFQMAQEKRIDGVQLQILNLEYEKAREELKYVKKEAREHPEDTELEMQLEEVRKRVSEIDTKRTQLRNELLGVD